MWPCLWNQVNYSTVYALRKSGIKVYSYNNLCFLQMISFLFLILSVSLAYLPVLSRLTNRTKEWNETVPSYQSTALSTALYSLVLSPDATIQRTSITRKSLDRNTYEALATEQQLALQLKFRSYFFTKNVFSTLGWCLINILSHTALLFK